MSFPSDTVIANDKTLAERPKTAQAFLNGTLRGWKYAIQHPDEAVNILLKAAPGLERPHQLTMLVEYGKLAAADLAAEKGIGALDKAKFEAARQVLIERKVLEFGVEVTKALDEPLPCRAGCRQEALASRFRPPSTSNSDGAPAPGSA